MVSFQVPIAFPPINMCRISINVWVYEFSGNGLSKDLKFTKGETKFFYKLVNETQCRQEYYFFRLFSDYFIHPKIIG